MTNLQINSKGQLQHFLDLNNLSLTIIHHLMDRADEIKRQGHHISSHRKTLQGETLVNLFFETSTRTRASFELAGKRLGAEVVNLHIATSSTQKGESLVDTLYTLEAMYCNYFILRHPDNNAAHYLAEHAAPHSHIINAGAGTESHPTQALLDMLTIRQYKSNFNKLSVAIVGDIRHSRVARSEIIALRKLGVQDIRLVGPAYLLTEDLDCTIYHDLKQGLTDVDVIMMLRIQEERQQDIPLPNKQDFQQHYGLTSQRLRFAKPDTIVMHPGPMNRGVEIDSLVADGPQSVIRQQVSNGLAMRMAILELLHESHFSENQNGYTQ